MWRVVCEKCGCHIRGESTDAINEILSICDSCKGLPPPVPPNKGKKDWVGLVEDALKEIDEPLMPKASNRLYKYGG